MGELLWLHSGGSFNKEPENDLGNYPSRFEISGEPPEEPNNMNNLFDDVMPEEVRQGMTDYRCFYFWNPNTVEAIQDLNLQLTQCEDCESQISHGSKLQDDIQEIGINCNNDSEPDVGGYVIFDTEFGAPFTVYYNGDWLAFGQDIQARIQEQSWCESVTVIGANPFTVTFTGGVGNRNVRLIRVVQNDLMNYGLCRYNTQLYFSCDDYNRYGASQVRVVQPISSHVPLTGTLRIYNPLTGLWDAYDYWGHDTFNFFLSKPLEFNLVGFLGSCPPIGSYPNPGDPDNPYQLINYPENWQRWYPSPAYYGGDPGANLPLPVPWGVIETPCNNDNYCQVYITKIQEGSPINCIAQPILTDTQAPDATFPSVSYVVGNLRPNEGLFWWVKRVTPQFAAACLRDYFDIQASADKVSWPLTTGGI